MNLAHRGVDFIASVLLTLRWMSDTRQHPSAPSNSHAPTSCSTTIHASPEADSELFVCLSVLQGFSVLRTIDIDLAVALATDGMELDGEAVLGISRDCSDGS